jgi:hypothetical protein
MSAYPTKKSGKKTTKKKSDTTTSPDTPGLRRSARIRSKTPRKED